MITKSDQKFSFVSSLSLFAYCKKSATWHKHILTLSFLNKITKRSDLSFLFLINFQIKSYFLLFPASAGLFEPDEDYPIGPGTAPGTLPATGQKAKRYFIMRIIKVIKFFSKLKVC